MSATELQFRTAAFGGFQKQDVISYIESMNQAHQEKLEQLQRERDQLAREKEELAAQASSSAAQVRDLEQEKEELSAQLDQARTEAGQLRSQLDSRSAELDQANSRLAQLTAQAEAAQTDAAAYRHIKDRAAGIELEAHCRAQEVQQAAEEKVQRAHTEVEQWLHKVNAGYELLRSDMDGAVARAGQELDKLRQLLDQLSSGFAGQDEHLRRLSQTCLDQFVPPSPLPLNEA